MQCEVLALAFLFDRNMLWKVMLLFWARHTLFCKRNILDLSSDWTITWTLIKYARVSKNISVIYNWWRSDVWWKMSEKYLFDFHINREIFFKINGQDISIILEIVISSFNWNSRNCEPAIYRKDGWIELYIVTPPQFSIAQEPEGYMR